MTSPSAMARALVNCADLINPDEREIAYVFTGLGVTRMSAAQYADADQEALSNELDRRLNERATEAWRDEIPAAEPSAG